MNTPKTKEDWAKLVPDYFRATGSRGDKESRGYAGLGQQTKGQAGQDITNKADAAFAEAMGNPAPTVLPMPTAQAPATPQPKTPEQSGGSSLLSAVAALARTFVSLPQVHGIINSTVPSELRNVGFTPGATGTQFLQLPAGWKTAVWNSIDWQDLLVDTGITVVYGGVSRLIKLREVDVCEDGTVKKMLVFASAAY